MATMGFMKVSRSLRETPTNDGPFVAIAGKGQIVEKIGEKDDFVHIRLVDVPGKPTGWVTASAVEIGVPEQEAIDKEAFIRTCWREAVFFGTNPHYVALVAELRSRVVNEDDGDYKGLYRLRLAEWMNAKWKGDEFHVSLKESDISDWRKQTTMFSLMTLRAIDEFVAANGKRRPNVQELYLAQIFGQEAAKKLQAGDLTKPLDSILADSDLEEGSQPLSDVLKRHEKILKVGGVVATVKQAIEQADKALQAALDATRPFLVATGVQVLEGTRDAVGVLDIGNLNLDASVIPPSRKDIATQIVSAFAAAGFGVHHQATALANAIKESSLNPSASNEVGEHSYGLFQFNIDPGGLGAILGLRKEDLLKADFNINAMVGVARNTASFRNAATLSLAMNAFVRDIENPKNKDAEVAVRLGIAEALLKT